MIPDSGLLFWATLYVTCDKFKDIFNIDVFGFAYMNKLVNWCVVPEAYDDCENN